MGKYYAFYHLEDSISGYVSMCQYIRQALMVPVIKQGLCVGCIVREFSYQYAPKTPKR